MARGRRDGIVIAGGGLAGALAALAMARHRPDVPLLVVEEAETFGGTGIRTFSDAELGRDGAGLIGAEAIARWPGIYLSFPGMNRNLRLNWSGFGGVDLHRALVEALDPKQYRLGTRVVAVREDALVLEGGEELKAESAIDARGPANLSSLELLYEVRLEREYAFAAPHRVDRPVLIDATVAQDGALRFMQCIPLSADRLVVGDVMVSERIQPDAETGARLDAYVAARGWKPTASADDSGGEHVEVRPLPHGGDFAAFWRLGGARVAKLGLRGGFIHPLTGRTLGDAVTNAMLLTRQRDFSAGALHDLFEAEAKQAWKKRELLRGVTAAFARTRPEGRRDLLAALYGLGPGTIAGLNTDDLGWIDRMKVRGAIKAA
ncbi:MAG TPA: lycopene cyclase family protein [Allosphingosinicella sp.]|nr:lycopene cyclase family protein [Allosphingosinicella sp.]